MDHSSPSHSPVDYAGEQSRRASSTIPRRPRLRSPHLFRDIFADDQDTRPRNAINLPPIHSQETLRDVRDALHRADMAVRNAQEAFRSRRTAPAHHSIVDLTNASPETSTNSTDGFFLSHHPDEIQRPQMSALRSVAYPLHEPVYGPPVNSNFGPSFDEVRHLASYARPRVLPIHDLMTTQARRERSDEEAVERQRQAHRNWERNQRFRERMQRERSEAAAAVRQQVQVDDSDDQLSISDDTDSPSSAATPASAMTPIDLTQVEDNTSLQALLSKQREDAIAAQVNAAATSTNDGTAPITSLSAYKCAICMDNPTDATTTVCGHLFCHKCIIDSLKWSKQQNRSNPEGRPRKHGTCPVCRKSLGGGDSAKSKARSLVPLEIKRVPRSWYETSRSKGKKRVRDSVSEDAIPDVDLLSPKNKKVDGPVSGKRPKTEKTEWTDEELFGEWIEDPI